MHAVSRTDFGVRVNPLMILARRGGDTDFLDVYMIDVSVPSPSFRKVNELRCPGASYPAYHTRHRSNLAFTMRDDGVMGIWDYTTGNGSYIMDGFWETEKVKPTFEVRDGRADPAITGRVSWRVRIHRHLHQSRNYRHTRSTAFREPDAGQRASCAIVQVEEDG